LIIHDPLASASGELSSRAVRGVGVSTSPAPKRRRHSIGRQLWWFAVPALVVYVTVVVSPTVQGIVMSSTDQTALAPTAKFIGTKNYVMVFSTDAGAAAIRTLEIALAAMVIQNVLGLLLAVVLNGRVLGRNLLRTIIFAPVVVSPLVSGYLFQFLFGPPNVGAVNAVFHALGLRQVVWLGQPNTALIVIVIVIGWQFTGSTMVIYLAGLQGVPEEILEAAALDGAGAFARFWFVTRPFLAPAVIINLMLGLIGGLKVFDQIFATTGGGPAGLTNTISTLIYQLITPLGNYGRASALAVLLAVAIAVLSIIQFAVLRRREVKA